jgi:hypothetical protein
MHAYVYFLALVAILIVWYNEVLGPKLVRKSRTRAAYDKEEALSGGRYTATMPSAFPPAYFPPVKN